MSGILRLNTERDAERRNYGDVAALIRSNPFVGAVVDFIITGVVTTVMQEIEKHLIPPAHELLGYPAVAKMMGKSQTSIRKMKERGQIIPVDHPVNGKTMFTIEAVQSAIVEWDIRHEHNREKQVQAALTLNTKNEAA